MPWVGCHVGARTSFWQVEVRAAPKIYGGCAMNAEAHRIPVALTVCTLQPFSCQVLRQIKEDLEKEVSEHHDHVLHVVPRFGCFLRLCFYRQTRKEKPSSYQGPRSRWCSGPDPLWRQGGTAVKPQHSSRIGLILMLFRITSLLGIRPPSAELEGHRVGIPSIVRCARRAGCACTMMTGKETTSRRCSRRCYTSPEEKHRG